MPEPIISVRNLSKAYRLYNNSKDRLKEAVFPWRKRHSLFYALNDVSFDIYPGEHIGILGVNGAGKTTLLEILTGVLTPTSGTVEVKGRVVALLALGSGFNPELSGRENAIFQLQLAGMNAEEVDHKVKEIEEFADVGEFFYQPTKLYSSGMFARVAFASAILSDPDILIVDEILSVGDARFQKKCADRMRKMKEAGVTIILVSHDVYGAKAASSRMFLLDQGKLMAEGDPEDVATQYMNLLYPPFATNTGNTANGDNLLANNQNTSNAVLEPHHGFILELDPARATNVWGTGGVSLLSGCCFGTDAPNFFQPGNNLIFEMKFALDVKKMLALADAHATNLKWKVALRIDNASSFVVGSLPAERNNDLFSFNENTNPLATIRINATFPVLAIGDYFFSLQIALGEWENHIALNCYENLFSLHCAHKERVHGLLEIDSSILLVNN